MSLKQKKGIDLIILFFVMSTIIISVAEFLYNDCFSLDNAIAPNLYGCIFTIAALSGTVLSILVSALDKKTYGITLRKFASFSSYPFKPIRLIIISMIIVLISTALLILELSTSLMFMLMILLVTVCVYFWHAWKVITDEKYCGKILTNEIEYNKHEPEFWEDIIKDIFKSCELAIKEINDDAINNNITLLSNIYHIVKDNESLSQIYSKHIKTITLELLNVDNLCKIGFSRAITLFSLVDPKIFIYKSDILTYSSKQYSLLKDETIMQISFRKLANEILHNKEIDKDEKIKYIEQIFASIFNNHIINNKNMIALLSQIISGVYYTNPTSDSEIENLQDTKTIIWLKIYTKYVLSNSNWELSLKIHDLMLSTIIQDISLFKDEQIVDLVSNMLLVQYSYGFLENELISNEQREKIKSLMQRKIKFDVEKGEISLSFLVERNMAKVLNQIKNIIESHRNFRYYEYWGTISHSKVLIWWDKCDRNSWILYCLYFNYYIYYDNHEIIYRTDDWNNIDNQRKGDILSNFMDIFDFSNGRIKPDWITKINEMGDWIGEKIDLHADMFAGLFERANEEKRQINLYNQQNNLDVVEPYEYSNESILYCNNIDNLKYSYVQYIDLGYNDINTFKDESLRVSAFSCCHYFLETLIKREFKSVELSFDIVGVNTLLDLINTQKIIYGNYIFTNDLIFSKEVRDSNKFKLLEQKLRGLSGCNDGNIYDHIYFGENIPQYNIMVYKPDRKQLTREEIEDVCSQNKLAEDRYRVQPDFFCNKQQAIEYVERFYRKDMIKIEIKHNFSDVDAYYVKIKRNRIKTK